MAYSALSLVVSLQGNDTIYEHKLIKIFLKGVFNKKNGFTKVLLYMECFYSVTIS